jgi:hypothetical protein
MVNKDGSVTLSGWPKGQAKHPIEGLGLLQNVEVFENKGIAKIKNRLTTASLPAVTPNGTPIAEVDDVYGNTYTLTTTSGGGTVYKNGVAISGMTGLTNAWDLAIYKGYLVTSYSTVLDAYGPINSGGAANYRVMSGFTDSYYGKLKVGQDGKLYRNSGNYVSKIEVTAAAVGVAPTFSQLTTLDIKDGEYAVTIDELGRNLSIGVHRGQSHFGRANYPGANLYPWNRQSGTLGNPGLADLPVSLNENGVNASLVHLNRQFVSAGDQGNIYETDGVNSRKIASLPYVKSGVFARSTVMPNAMDISPQGTLLVGLTVADDNAKGGIYEIDINAPLDPVTLEYPVSFRTISTGNTGSSSNPLTIGFLNVRNYQTMRVGWAYGSTYGVDETDQEAYANFAAVIEGQLEQVGTPQNPKTFEQVEFNFAEPLVDGQSVRLSYRLDATSTYTTINTWAFEDVGGVSSFIAQCPIADAVFVEFKVELDQEVSTLAYSNVNFINARIY